MKKYLLYIVLCLPLFGMAQIGPDDDQILPLPTGCNKKTFWRDKDGDGYGNPNDSYCRDSAPSGYIPASLFKIDCDDNNASIKGLRTWYRDKDGDGYGISSDIKKYCNRPTGYASRAGDCNDNNAQATVVRTWYRDVDGDGYGVSTNTKTSCNPPSGYASQSGDCNDSDGSVFIVKTWYRDADGDGYGTTNDTKSSCNRPSGYIARSGDCDDTNPLVKPGGLESCNGDGIDNNCNGQIDERSPDVPKLAPTTQECGRTILRQQLHLVRYRWYWQSSATGTSKANSAQEVTRTSGSVYYLRSFDTQTNCWSAAKTINYTINTVPTTPALPTITKNCGNTIITPSNTTGVTWYWQQTATGTDTANTGGITRTQSGSIYLRGRSTGGCWGPARKVDYTITQPTTWYSDSDQDGFGDPAVSVQECTQPPGYVTNNNDRCPDIQGDALGCTITPYVRTAFSENQNYIFMQVYQKPMTSSQGLDHQKDVIESITYFDGLGRPVQQSQIKASTNEKDIATHIEYDGYGRQAKQYLPFEFDKPHGSYRDVDVNSHINSYYLNTYSADFPGITNASQVNAYSERIFEPSPLNRVVEQGAPGTSWKANPNSDADHTLKFDWNTNDNNEVVYFKVTFQGGDTEKPVLQQDGFYAENELVVTVTKDENWTPADGDQYTTKEYQDKLGRVILKRTFNSSSSSSGGGVATGGGAHDTYYVYDDFGNLSFVLPPKVEVTDGVSTEELNELCYQYQYDFRNRLIEKKIPGKGWEYIVYNKLDQPIMTQDANLKTQGDWLFTKYDAFERVAYTGKIRDNRERKTIQQESNAYSDVSWVGIRNANVIGNTTMYYNDGGYPKATTAEVLTIQYYDDYGFLGIEDAVFNAPTTVYGISVSDKTKSLATASKVKVLDMDQWITTVTYYDDKGRPIYVATKNEYLNTTDIVESKLDFTGRVLETKTTHTKGSNAPIITIDKFTYDHVGRLLTQTQKINDQETELIVANNYDELGQLVAKNVGGTSTTLSTHGALSGVEGLQTVNYTYNIRGWLKGINDVNTLGNDLFSFAIDYDKGANPLYNGNISKTMWKTANDNVTRSYDYTYDALSRITSGISNDGRYNLSNVTYDKIGNILTLHRKGHLDADAATFGDMDILSYFYDDGNKLLKVTDAANKTYGFKDGANTQDDYSYDANGNLLVDRNKDITGIVYNHLNLPTRVNVNAARQYIRYIYDATGVKLKKIVTEDSGRTITDYAGNYIYKNGQLEFFNHPEGYVEKEADGYKYVYQFKDNLDNIRLSYKDVNKDGSITQDEIVQEKNYYPFGLTHRGYNSAINGNNHTYGFGSKEFTVSLGLNTYDFGSRNYMSDLGRWGVIDPKADDIMQIDLTPYNYSWNNPTNINDPDGECPWCWGAAIGFVVEYTAQVATNLANGQELGDALTDVDGGKLLVATATGALSGGLASIKVVGAAVKVYKAVAVSTTVTAGNIVEQKLDGNKTVDAAELAIEIATDKVPLPKIKASKLDDVSKNTMKTVERKLDRAERIAGDNPRPSRAEAVKKSKKDLKKLRNKQQAIDGANKTLPQVPEGLKEVVKESVKTEILDYKESNNKN